MTSAQPHFQTDFPTSEFERRRERLFGEIGGARAVIAGGPATGAFDRFRQTNDFYYLCGVEVPHAYLLLDGKMRWTILYLPRRDPKLERSEGTQLNSSDADRVRQITGVDEVKPLEALTNDLRETTQIYTLHAPAEGREACRDTLLHARQQIEADPWDGRPSAEQWFREKLVAICPYAEFLDLSPVVDRLRLIKSHREVELMRRAGRLTARGVIDAMRITRPGLFEFELAAVADYLFLRSGARGPGYRPIVASGSNIWNAHYFRNDSLLQDGDLVLMDYAPDVGCYTSDIGRMWPVNGTYSPVQRELYGFVVEFQKVLLKTIREKRSIGELAREAAEAIRPVWTDWGWSKPEYREAARKMIESEVAFTHPVGMAVHDVGEYKQAPLETGLVFALDPQLWVPEEQIYVRVEDTIVVTPNGVESLTRDAPLDLDAIEQLVRSSHA
ncbi:MAG: aminopeptidase P N-terminal domain-containing protein [Planctomycetes bacterium]|nr:aminopeptidase P N-terminal domain-containing protein [Planctomycetota bacterium]